MTTGSRPADPFAGPLEPASREDLTEVLDLLDRCGLPPDGVAEHLDRFVIAREGGRIIACSGIEVHAEGCVLRSLAVDPAHRGRGLAHRLIRRTLAMARDAGCAEAYLLTLTIAQLAERYGFARIDRDLVPRSVLASREFSLTTCASAAVMRLLL